MAAVVIGILLFGLTLSYIDLNTTVVTALGLEGDGALALARRIRTLLSAAAGLALYPRVRERRR